jgi:hypothetical protein
MKVFADEQRITIEDERFYQTEGGDYLPSVTTILDCYPKGKRFEQWLKDVGNAADDIIERAGNDGTAVHDGIDVLLSGKELKHEAYTVHQWKMILKFVDFFMTFKPLIIAREIKIVSSKIGAGGTIDFICMINGERWLIDHKTSASIYDNHFVQVATYAAMWNDQHPDQKIQRIGVLHLKATTKGPDKTGKRIQGAGWKLEEPEDSISELYEVFKHVKALYHRINPNDRPVHLTLPGMIQLDAKAYEEPKPVEKRKPVDLPAFLR